MPSVNPVRRAAAGMLARATRWVRWLAQHQVLCLILFFSFVARLFLANWKSYWYDELLSVAVYGSNHATLVSALKNLANHSAHPPLYHAILYYWMQIFGTEEVTTRTLSNLYITGATLCLYLLALRLFGRRVAIASALLFAFSYTATYFGLEVRSYAQSLFLVTLSSLLLWRWLDHAEDLPTWGDLFAGRAALLLCNIALLLTHYSNALFVIVQALFAGFFFAHRGQSETRLRTLSKLAAFYVTQFAAALAIWGPTAWSTHKRFAGNVKYSVHGFPQFTPPEMFFQSVVRPSLLEVPLVLIMVVLVGLTIVLIRSAKQHFLRADTTPPLNQYFLFYLTAWATLPCVLAYLVYFAAGLERYIPRYFAICIPPFSILLVLALEQFVVILDSARRKLKTTVRRSYLRNSLLYALIACALFALPGAYVAAEDPKGLYRDIARSIVRLVEQDPKSSFVIFEAALRRQPLLDYYLERFSKKTIRVDGTLRMDDEKPGRDSLKRLKDKVAERDYLIVAFPFVSAHKFPILLPLLQSRYSVAFSQMSRNGRGYIVFELRSAKSRDGPSPDGD